MEFLSLTSLNEALEKHDVGRIINSACVVGQIQGAVAQSISYATDESMHFAKAEYIATKNDNTECPFVDKDSGEAPVPLPLAVIVSTLANDIGKLTRKILVTLKDLLEALAGNG